VVRKQDIDSTGAISIGEVMRRIPGVQSSDSAGTSGSAISLNIGVRGLTGRFSPRSTVLLDGIPCRWHPGQPQLSFAPLSLNNIESIDVIRGGGAVRFGPQNVGGIINFKTRSIPASEGISGDASVRYNSYGKGGGNAQYTAFAGGQGDNGLGMAFLYSGQDGSGWRDKSDEHLNDFALKMRYEISASAELYAKLNYYDVMSRTPGGLSTAQYAADPFQNTRLRDNWSGTRKGFDVGYLNTLSDHQELEIRTYFNQATRQSSLINATGVRLSHQPRNYETLGIEPRYTQRFAWGSTTHDVTVGYRTIRERGDDNIQRSGPHRRVERIHPVPEQHRCPCRLHRRQDRFGQMAHHAGPAFRTGAIEPLRNGQEDALRGGQRQAPALDQPRLPAHRAADPVQQLQHLVRRGAEFAAQHHVLRPSAVARTGPDDGRGRAVEDCAGLGRGDDVPHQF
jgi:outer membrane receptor for Fe3+-dicitrate